MGTEDFVGRLSHIAPGILCLSLLGHQSQGAWAGHGTTDVEISAGAIDLSDEEQTSAQPVRLPTQTPPRPGTARPEAARPGTLASTPVQAAPAAQPPAPSPATPAASTPVAPPASPPVFSTSPNVAALGRSVSDELAASTFAAQPETYGGLGGTSAGGIPVMIGDLGPIPVHRLFPQATGSGGLPPPFPPPTPPTIPHAAARRSAAVIPSVRGTKISDNQSPRPLDRVYFSFNYFQGLNTQINQAIKSPIGYTQAFRYIGGFEKTFLDGQGSFGIQAPLNSVTAQSTVPKQFGNYGGSSTAVGDMTIYAKYILVEDREAGNLLSAGLAVSPPTGPGRFAGLTSFASVASTTTFQPFLGYIYNFGQLYVHGFLAIDVPANSQNATLLYNDFGLGYFLRRPDPKSELNPVISMIAPTFEIHVTDPLNHRDPFNPRDPAGVPDIVNFTYGLNVGFFSRPILTLGIVTPVSSPKPFDFEALAYLNFFYGGSRRSRAQIVPPVAGN
jgi:hypothetical protein